MARITRHSFRCPHCQHEIAASWGDANYMALPDAFSCPRCRQVVTLSPEQRLSKAADQAKNRGAGRVLLCIFASLSLIAILLRLKMSEHLAAITYVFLIGGVLMGTMFIFVIVQAIRRDRAYNRLKTQIMPK